MLARLTRVPRGLARRARGLGRRGRRLAGRVRGWLAGRPLARRIARVALDLPVAARAPRLGAALIRADLDHPDDIALLPLVDRALARHPSRALLRRRAGLLNLAGEPTAALATWRDLERIGEPGARDRVRILEGRLRETDTSWLPALDGAAARLEPASRTRILHLLKSAAPERWSGFTIRTLQNLRAQRAAGLEPIVVTQLGWPREAGVTSVLPTATVEGFETHYLDRGSSYRPRSLPVDVALQDTTDDLAPVVETVRPAIIHVHSGHRGGELALAALALRQRYGVPVVYEVRGLFESSWTADLRVAERAEMFERRLAQETRILEAVDGVLAISEALADLLASRGIDRRKVSLLPNGIDPEALVPRPRDAALRQRLGLDGRRVVGYLGNLDHWREGIDVLIDAVAILHRRGLGDVAMLVVGEGTRRPELEARARRAGLGVAARFTGRVPHEEVGAYYAQMDVFTNPRVDERAARYITPLKPYEAMALELPVVVSDLPALREIVDPPRRGIVAPPGDPSGLADALASLLEDAERRAELGRDGRAWVTAERSWSSNGPRQRAAYEAILGSLD